MSEAPIKYCKHPHDLFELFYVYESTVPCGVTGNADDRRFSSVIIFLEADMLARKGGSLTLFASIKRLVAVLLETIRACEYRRPLALHLRILAGVRASSIAKT